MTQLERGMILRDLPARTLDGRDVYAMDYRGRRNLVLIFAGQDREELALLDQLRRSSDELQEEEAVALVAAADDELRRQYAAIDSAGHPMAALYVTDRYGEIFFAAHPDGLALPGVAEVLDWLRFINAQCPE